ncbi:hypothetical protein K438DRAFT_1813983 [Mycena galopus ATCC 62051]|nr:hypothetical protein K438DRAFT_1813983 [Mycena galopus ATCC 62051]
MLPNLQEDRNRVAFLDAQILALENPLPELRSERALVQRRLQSYIYPVLTLPTEIVSEIFSHFVPRYPRCPPLIGALSPTTLTHICHEWREIAVSTPTLWRAICVSDYDLPEGRTHIVDLWLKRSRSCPLSIELDEAPRVRPTKAFLLIEPQRPRWEYLKLHSFISRLPVIEGSMPLLRHLELRLDGSDLSGGMKDIRFRQCPLLRSAVLDGDVNWVTLPWAQLTSLALSAYLQQCVSVLKQTHNLIHCKLRFSGFSSHYPTAITFPHLESLEFSGASAERAHCYLQSFITPALRNLRIPEIFLGDDPVHSLLEFMSKYEIKLHEIRISNRSLPRTSYYEALQSVPKVSFSRFYYGELDSDQDSENESDSDSSDIAEVESVEV